MENSGVYQIRNLNNQKVYIGGTDNLNERMVNHFSELRRGVHHSIHLQRAWNKTKDPENVFKFEILEYCIPDWLVIQPLENQYLAKIGKADEYIKGENNDFLKLTYNIKPYAQRGFFGRHREGTLQKLKLCSPFRKDILCYNKDRFIDTATSAKEAYRLTGCSKGSILKACKSKRFFTKKGYLFCFSEDINLIEEFIEKGKIKYEPYNKGKKYESKEKFTQRTKISVYNSRLKSWSLFESQVDACKFFRLQSCTVNRCLKSGKPYKKYLTFSYYEAINI